MTPRPEINHDQPLPPLLPTEPQVAVAADAARGHVLCGLHAGDEAGGGRETASGTGRSAAGRGAASPNGSNAAARYERRWLAVDSRPPQVKGAPMAGPVRRSNRRRGSYGIDAPYAFGAIAVLAVACLVMAITSGRVGPFLPVLFML